MKHFKNTLFFLALTFSLSAQNINSGLIGYFPFNGNAGDSSGFSNHGTLIGAIPIADRNGNLNSAYNFDGVNDVIHINSYSNMSPTAAVSIAVWVRTISFNGQPWIYDRIETNDGYGLRLNSVGRARLTINGGTQEVVSSSVITDGQWHHIAAIYDQSVGKLSMYIDGVLENTSQYGTSITYSPEPRNSIGGTTHTGGFFDGDMDELRIYGRALSICEVQALAGVTATPGSNLNSDLIGFYHHTANAADSSGNGNDGTVQGAALADDRFGNANQAYYFDGIDDIININSYTNMSPANAVTISAWILTDSYNNLPWIYDRIETNEGFGLRLNSSGQLRLTINGGSQDAVSTTQVADSTWHHVVGVYSMAEGKLRVYVDGVQEAASNYSSPITYFPEPRNSIGGSTFGNHFFKGLIDDIRIYNKALSDCEVAELFQVADSTGTGNISVAETKSLNDGILVFPNPSSGEVNVVLDEGKEIRRLEVYDTFGKIIFNTNKFTSRISLDASAWARGIYVIRIIGDQSVNDKKLIVY